MSREEPLNEAELRNVLEYMLDRLHRGESAPSSRVCALRVLHRVGHGPSSAAIHAALAQLTEVLCVCVCVSSYTFTVLTL